VEAELSNQRQRRSCLAEAGSSRTGGYKKEVEACGEGCGVEKNGSW
jgi:hypothetical protein